MNSLFLTVEQICRIICLLRPKHELLSFGWFMGSFTPFPQTSPNVTASPTRTDWEKPKRWVSPGETLPEMEHGLAKEEEGGKPSSEPGPTTPLVRACLSASLSGLTVVTAAAAVGGSVCLSLCVKKYETELFFILELCCCSHDIKNKKIYFWSSILSLTLGSFCCPDSGRLPCLQAACKIQPGTRYGGRLATCARAKCLFGGGKCFADEMI